MATEGISQEARIVMAGALATTALAPLAWLLGWPGWLVAILSATILVALLMWQAYCHRRASQQSLDSLRASLASSTLAVLVVDERGNSLEANPAFMSFARLPEQQAGAAILPSLPEAWRLLIADLHRNALAHGSNTTSALLPFAGGTAFLRVQALRLRHPDGSDCTLLLWDNLSAQRAELDRLLTREQSLLERSQAFVQTLIDVIPQPVYIKHISDSGSHYIQVNSAFCSAHNQRREDLVGKDVSELFNALRAAEIYEEDLRVIGGMPMFREEQTIDPQTGKDRFTVVCKQACIDAEGRRVLVGTNIDVTPWRMAERNLKQVLQREVDRRERERDFVQRILDVIPQPMHVKDSRCRYLMVNEAFVRDRGRPREELLGKDPAEVVNLMVGDRLDAQDNERARARLSLQEDHEVLNGGSLIKEEHNFHSVTGEERFRTIYKSGCLDTEGQPAIVTAIVDVTSWRITERKLADALAREKALRERTQAFTQRLIDLIPEEFYVKDAQSRYLLVNRAFLKHRRLESNEQVVGRSMDEVAAAACHANPHYQAHPELIEGAIIDHRARAQQSREEDLAVLAGHNLLKEDHSVLPHTGEERYFLVAKTAAEDAEGSPVIVCANFNITALRQAEKRLAENGLSLQAPDDSTS